MTPQIKRFKSVAGWMAFILFIATQWELPLWPLFAETFFICTLTWQSLVTVDDGKRWRVFVILGGVLNAIALTANGGRMPALGATTISRWWQPFTQSTRFPFLCDIYATFSIGDLIMVGTILCAIGMWAYKKMNKPKVSPQIIIQQENWQ